MLASVVEAEQKDAQLLVRGRLELPQYGQQTHYGDLKKEETLQLQPIKFLVR